MEEKFETKNLADSSDVLVLEKKKKIGKKQITIIITAALLALLIVAYTVINALIGAWKPEGDSGNKITPPDVDESVGEGIYNNRAVTYPYLAKDKILSISVKSHKDAFVISRPEAKEEGKYESYFMLFYEDDKGELTPYYPGICYEEDVDYTDFYAKESSDGLNAFKLDYLCAAIGALYFDNRIEPEEDRAAQLNRYGLNAEDREAIYITYLDENGEEKEYRIYVGDGLISGVGFYFMIDGRDYIYTSVSSERFKYLLGEFETLLHSRLVAEGLEADGLYEPYLTTDYKQWVNTYYGITNGGVGMLVSNGSEVIVNADVVNPIYNSAVGANPNPDGYRYDGYTTMAIDLQFVSARPEFNRLIKALTTSRVGDYEGNEIVASIITNINEADLGKTYKYVIRGVEAILNDDGEFETEGMPVGDNDLIKVEYDYYIDGERINVARAHAIVDLSKESVIPDSVKATLRAASIGDSLNEEFETVYTEENSVKRNVEFVITDIVLISKIGEDGKISYPEKIDETSIVTYKYKYIVDGYEIGKDGTSTVDLSAITEGDDLVIKNAIIGKEIATDMNLSAVNSIAYCQPFSDFITYRIKTIRGFVQKEQIVSFEFVNASEQDPFNGDTVYKNTLENANKYYALNDASCRKATYLLGGIGDSASTTQLSAGLSGSETVAVGLTPYNMDKYGLYDGYTIYYELPRGIATIAGTDDFRYLSTLGFTLYISKTQSDGTRYVGSNMYDIIVKIDGSLFDYLEKSFEDYWAKNSLVMVDYKLVERVDVELGMTDIYGKYSFGVDHKTIYIVGNEHYDTRPETGGTEYHEISVTATPLSERHSETALKTWLEKENRESMKLANLYNRVAGLSSSDIGWSIKHDTAGDSSFKEMLRLVYAVDYVGVLTQDEVKEAFASAPKIMSMTFKLVDVPYGYTYDFYRVSDRRVMVHLYRIDSDGNRIDNTTDEVAGYYISTFAAKKIVNAVGCLLNGKLIDVDANYWE